MAVPPPELLDSATAYSEDASFVGEAGMLGELPSKYMASPRALTSMRPDSDAEAGKLMTNATLPAMAKALRARAHRGALMQGRNVVRAAQA